MTIAIPDNRVLTLVAKDGGGFQSGGLVSTPAAFTPMVANDFLEGTLGASRLGWKNSAYDSTYARSGSQSLKISTAVTQTGSCPSGGANDRFYAGRQALPEIVPVGKTVWQRYYCYFPSAFSFGYLWSGGDTSAASGCGIGDPDGSNTLKFLVFSPSTTTGRAYLYLENQRRQINQQTNALFRVLTERAGSPLDDGEYTIPRDEWVAIQFAVKVSNTGDGWMRAWANTQLLAERLNCDTVSGSDAGMGEYGIGDYWNGFPWTDGAAGRSDFWIDEEVVASDMDGYGAPTDTDSQGNAYIAPTTLVGALS